MGGQAARQAGTAMYEAAGGRWAGGQAARQAGTASNEAAGKRAARRPGRQAQLATRRHAGRHSNEAGEQTGRDRRVATRQGSKQEGEQLGSKHSQPSVRLVEKQRELQKKFRRGYL